MAVFGGNNGSTVVTSQFLIVNTYGSHHTKVEPWNPLINDFAPRVLKAIASALPLVDNIIKTKLRLI